MLPKFSVAVATLLSVAGGVQALISSSDIPSDTPISSLLNSANVHLAKGETNDALTYYDIAISRDPASYLTYFKRGATYLSLGKTAQATQDFDKVLEIKPGFEGALLQRAKIKAKNGEFDAARKDYLATSNPPEQELIELSEAQGAAALATDAEKNRNWEECVTQSGVAIMVASRMLSLRQTRAHCRFERGEVEEGMSDLKHVLQMQPGRTEPHMQISSITFYGLGDMAQGMDQIRKCLHSDPDSKSCKKLYRQEKRIDKLFSQVNKNMERKSYASAVKILLPSGEDVGLVQEIKDDVQALREAGTIPSSSQGSIPTELIFRAVEMVCEAYSEMKNTKKATQWCDEALTYNEHSLHGLLSKARKHMETEDFEAAIRVLNEAKEHHPGAQQIGGMMNNAQIELKRSKTKDYYKVLGLPRDADERQIRAAYRRMVKIHHPDKAHQQGITKEEAEKKMGAVNEAYEVLNDPELKARFDRGDDPNDHEQQRQHPFQQGGNPFAGHPFQQSGGGGQQFNFKFAQGGFNFG